MNYLTLENIRQQLKDGYEIHKTRIHGTAYDATEQYRLLQDVHVELSDGERITIPYGFKWDNSSVPRILTPLLPRDGDHEIAALIHDYLYRKNLGTRKFADYEMLLWSREVNYRHFWLKLDNELRYVAVRAAGSVTWNRYMKQNNGE